MNKQKLRKTKKPKVKTVRFVNDVWQYVLFVRIGGTKEQAVQWFEKRFDLKPAEFGKDSSRGCCIYANGESSHLIWFDDIPGGALAAHEAFHSAVHIGIESGLSPVCEQNEEAYAYLIAWTVHEIGRRFW